MYYNNVYDVSDVEIFYKEYKTENTLKCLKTSKYYSTKNHASLANMNKSARTIELFAWKVSVFGVSLVRIFSHLDWIQRYAAYLSVFSPNAGKYGPENLRVRTLFTQWFIFTNKKLCTECSHLLNPQFSANLITFTEEIFNGKNRNIVTK